MFSADFAGGFSAEQLVQALLSALSSRGLHVTREHLRLEVIRGIGHVGLELTEDFVPVPPVPQWQRLMAGLDPSPARPAVHYTCWGFVQLVTFTHDEVPRLHFVLSVVREGDQEILRRVLGTGTKNVDGLRQAIAGAFHDAGLPLHDKHLWLGRPGDGALPSPASAAKPKAQAKKPAPAATKVKKKTAPRVAAKASKTRSSAKSAKPKKLAKAGRKR